MVCTLIFCDGAAAFVVGDVRELWPFLVALIGHFATLVSRWRVGWGARFVPLLPAMVPYGSGTKATQNGQSSLTSPTTNTDAGESAWVHDSYPSYLLWRSCASACERARLWRAASLGK